MRILNEILNLFFPNLCLICHRPLIKGERQICIKCLCDLPRTGFHKIKDNPVEQLYFGKFQIEHATAYLKYEKGGNVQKIVHSLKYHDNMEIGYILGREIALELKADDSPLCDVDLLLPVPLHKRKMRKRGYNQSECIAKGISSILNIPVDTNSLMRVANNDTQTHKSIYDRWINVSSIFKLVAPEALEGKHILLIDDVITTGATSLACVEELSRAKDTRISILSLSAV